MIPLTQAERSFLGGLAASLSQTPQDPQWHAEGSVLIHTGLVCRALETLPEYLGADDATRKLLHTAALLHDIGKLSCTRQEDGRWISPGHSRVGADMARQLLWLDHSLCGTPEAQQFREGVCTLIRYHSLPLHAIGQPDGKLRLLKFAANGHLSPFVTVENLCTLAKADILGRICQDQQEQLEKVELCRELAAEEGCLSTPYPFPSEHTAFQFLSGMAVPKDYPLYDDTWGQVILLSGLPGTGKDTWIQTHCPEMPMVSLDRIRLRLGVSPTENQSRVLEAAREEAKQYLRSRTPFVWNATNLSPMVRSRQTGLFTNYGASVRIVYLETRWQEQLSRNRNRSAMVPEDVMGHMLETLSPPERWEAHRVDWLCV